MALAIAYIPNYSDLSALARNCLFILCFAATTWISEAIPAFATSLLVIGLQIILLGTHSPAPTATPDDWQMYVATWGSPLIWLFLGGFVLSAAAEKTGLTHRLADTALRIFGSRPQSLLLGCMLITFVFSMFISNTATATMMLAIMMPLVQTLNQNDPFRAAMLIAVAFSSGLGGMGSIIGSPPNAIAVGALQKIEQLDFLDWLRLGTPPALAMLIALWLFLCWRYPSAEKHITLNALTENHGENRAPLWEQLLVVLVFTTTVALWMTQSWHGLPPTVVSFIPICTFTAFGVLNAKDICSLRWDILLLIAGGLSLGVAITSTELDHWLLQQVQLEGYSPLVIASFFIILTIVVSNLMSNTAAANLIIPIAMAAAPNQELLVVMGIALGASAAMCLPISTPPNAIVYGTGFLRTRDLIACGLFIALVAPPILLLWLQLQS